MELIFPLRSNAIVCSVSKGLIKLRELVRSPLNKDLEIHLRQADPESYRAVLKEIKTKEIHNIIIDTKSTNMQHFLKGVSFYYNRKKKRRKSREFAFIFMQILQLQMNDYKYHYLFTTFDIETFDLEDFKYNFVNMTAFRVVDAADLYVQEILRDMAKFQGSTPPNSSTFNSTFIQVNRPLFLSCRCPGTSSSFRS